MLTAGEGSTLGAPTGKGTVDFKTTVVIMTSNVEPFHRGSRVTTRRWGEGASISSTKAHSGSARHLGEHFGRSSERVTNLVSTR